MNQQRLFENEPKSIADIMMKKFQVKKTRGGINSSFAEAVARVQKAIPDQEWSFKRWCGYLRNIPVSEINCMIASAKKNKNPGRMFNYLIKEYKKMV